MVFKTCEFKGCKLNGLFDVTGGKGRFCATHKTAEMVDVKHNLCKYEGCTTRPSYGLEKGKALFCATHKTTDMFNVVSKRCAFEGCTVVNPNFGFIGEKGTLCSTHKQDGMIDLKHKHCEYDECNIQAVYDIKGGKGRFCATHKLDGMVDIKNAYCEYLGCTIVNPVFNNKGTKKGRFCASHKTPDMVDVKHNKCEYEGCDVRPTFNIKGENAKFCTTHKLDNMIDVTHKSCEFEDCIVRPTFDIKGGKGRFCAKHKLNGMVDIANKLCTIDNCIIRARYGKPGQLVSHCASHREKGMILKPTAKCSDCKELAVWGIGLTPKHCDIHKLENEINLVERNCTSCGLLYILDKDNKCENCNPDTWVSARLAKQSALMSYLDSRNLIGESTDKIIEGGVCGKERPDRMYDFGDKIIILECDEYQHRDRNCVCEQTRMINIGQTFGGVPVYFIRFNPDDYSPLNFRKKIENINKRHKLCGDLINDIKDNRIKLPQSLVSVIYLYYDDWSSLEEEKWEICM